MRDCIPKTIAIDVTPLLPGGGNGGVKILTLTLIEQLARLAPHTQFLLLTQQSVYEELACLEGVNVSRYLLPEPGIAAPVRRWMQRAGRLILPLLPSSWARGLGRLGYAVHGRLKGAGRRQGLLKQLGADVLLCPFTAPTFAEPSVPCLSVLHDLQFKTYPELFAPDDLANRDWSFRDACQRADALVAISRYTLDSALATGLPKPECMHQIYPRVASRMGAGHEADDRRLLKSYRLRPGRYLLYPANFWKHKNHALLLTAFGIAAQTGLPANFALVCTGAPGARQQELIATANALGIGSRLCFPGYVTEDTLAVMLRGAGGLVFPSLYEGFGMPVIEAMAAGVPVACSQVTALPEVAGDAALLFDPHQPDAIAQAMVRLITDQALRARLIAAGRQRAAALSEAERMAAEYWALICALMTAPVCVDPADQVTPADD
ncbi:glycosyltransferase family 4 protein [Rhabdochromatium marinum]|uniref:glycosyltransferase family 4 protein n=1 Tax=Rhabdochromatium marinum TaxID=48729 RepID=UPI0019035D7E|nr:glycosyltransferase family 1 protein [Rhabdochromatium marinum]MBK1647757.1 hypothetical protein [Rhabdochromatium marinum]